MIRPRTIQTKLLAIFIGAAVVPLALVSALSYRNSLKAVEEMVGNRTSRLAGSVGEELDRKLRRRLGDRILFQNEPVQRFLTVVDEERDADDRVHALMDLQGYAGTLFEEYGRYYREMILADAEGTPVFRAGRSKGLEQTIPPDEIVAEMEAPQAVSVLDSLAALFPEELPLPGKLAERVEAYGRSVQEEIEQGEAGKRRDADVAENLAEAGESVAKARARDIPSPLPAELLTALNQAFRRNPLEMNDPGFIGPELPRDGQSYRARLLETYLQRRFTEEERLAARTGMRLVQDENLIFVHRGAGGQAEAVRLVRPIFSVQDATRRLGTIILDLRVDYLFPEDLSGERFGSKGELAVINIEDGEILYHTRHELAGQNVQVANPALSAALDRQETGPEGASWFEVKEPGGRRLGGFYQVDAGPPGTRGVGWAVVATAVPREFESEARKAGLINLLVAEVALVLALAVLLISSRKISRSIHVVTEGARAIAAGNLNHAIRVSTHDEIDTLAETFNAMTASLRENIALRENAAQELEALNRTLEDRVQERTHRLTAVNEALNRANQELKELDRLKSNFLATVSHEFKTPLTSITAFSEILIDEMEERSYPAEVMRFLHIIHTESERLGRLIRNLLDLSRIEAGRMRWERSTFLISDVLGASLDGLLPVFAEKDIRVERELSCPRARVTADKDRIQQVITNLLENAVKFSERGKRVWISCREHAEEGNGGRALRITVEDEGPGISAAYLGRIFERFWQVDTTETRRTGGSGLGLAISKEIVEHHGGRIWAESDPGRGASFHFTLPVASEDEADGTGETSAPQMEPTAKRGEPA